MSSSYTLSCCLGFHITILPVFIILSVRTFWKEAYNKGLLVFIHSFPKDGHFDSVLNESDWRHPKTSSNQTICLSINPPPPVLHLTHLFAIWHDVDMKINSTTTITASSCPLSPICDLSVSDRGWHSCGWTSAFAENWLGLCGGGMFEEIFKLDTCTCTESMQIYQLGLLFIYWAVCKD